MTEKITDRRMGELIEQAKDAAKIEDFAPCAMGLPPRFGFSDEVYKITLSTLVELERGKEASHEV